MKTTLALLIDRCGLSQKEAADFLCLKVDAVRSLATGRNQPRAAAIDALRRLYGDIERAAAEILVDIEERAEGVTKREVQEIVLAIATDNAAARTLGWPSVGAQEAMLGIVAARAVYRVRTVPHGSDPDATVVRVVGHLRDPENPGGTGDKPNGDPDLC